MKPLFTTVIVLVCALCILVQTSAIAAGTRAGTVITNVATMNYKDLAGNSYPAFNSNTVTIVVQQVAGVAINPTTSSHASGDSTYHSYSIQREPADPPRTGIVTGLSWLFEAPILPGEQRSGSFKVRVQ